MIISEALCVNAKNLAYSASNTQGSVLFMFGCIPKKYKYVIMGASLVKPEIQPVKCFDLLRIFD